MLQKIVIDKVIQLVAKKFKISKILDYVEKPNELDVKVDSIETTLLQHGRLIEFLIKGSNDDLFFKNIFLEIYRRQRQMCIRDSDYNMDTPPVEIDTDYIVINDANEIDIYDPNKDGSADFRDNQFTLGSRTQTVKPEYYNVDGALRVCDSNFEVIDTTENVAMTANAAITKNDITIKHTTGTIPEGSIIQIDQEIMYVTNGSSNSTDIKVIRGFANTKIATHAHDTNIFYVNVPKYFGHIKADRLFECATSNSVNAWTEDVQTPQPPNNTRKSDGTTGTLASSAGIQSLRVYDIIEGATANYPAESEKVVLEFGESAPNIGILKVDAASNGRINVTTTNTHGLAVGETINISGTVSTVNSIAGEHEIKSVSGTTFSIDIDGSNQTLVNYDDDVYRDETTTFTAHTIPNTVKVTLDDNQMPTGVGTYFVNISGQTGATSFNGIKLANEIDNDNFYFSDVNASSFSASGTTTIQLLLGVVTVVGENTINEDLKRKWNFAMSFTYDGPGQEVQESLLTQGHKITAVTQSSGASNLLTSGIDNSTDPVTVPVDDGTAFSAGDIIMLGTEQLKVGAVSSNNLTGCVRQFNNTAIATHADDTQVFKIEELSPTATVDWTNFTVAPKCVIKSVYNFGTDEKSWNARINGFKIYMKDVTEDDASKEFRLFAEVNLNKGTYTIFAAGDSELILEQPATHAISTVTDGTTLTIKPIDTYLSENLFTEQTIIDAQYKVSEVVGRRVYIGNIRQGGRTYPDRMLRSPVNKFDTFPETNFIDVAVGDGDRITALKSFGDRLLQYKRDTVYIINTSGDSEVLESEYPNAGVDKPSQVVKTNLGIAWLNESGLWFFNGQQITNLTRNLRDSSFPVTSLTTAIIGFDKYTNRVIFTPQIGLGALTVWYIYDLELQSYQHAYYGDLFPFSETGQNFYTNIINDSEGNMIVGYVDEGDSDKLNFYQWSNDAGEGNAFGSVVLWKSKDIDFGSPAVNKKIYKVYVTYKSTGHSGVKMQFATDGSNSFTDFSSSKSTNYNVDSFSSNATSTGFKNSDGVWQVAELKPTSSINNVKSIQLSFDSIQAHSGTCQSGSASTTTLKLADAASGTDGAYNDYNINIYAGNARYNTRLIENSSNGTQYNGTTKVVTLKTALTDKGYGNTHDTTTKYMVGGIATDFEINDITIVFRPKRVK